LVLKEVIDRLHDNYIASKTSTTKLGFQFGSTGAKSGENEGGEEFQSRSQLQHATWDV
jgi:hypothetical protein